VRTYVVGANLAVCTFNCISKQVLIIRAVWRLIDALNEAIATTVFFSARHIVFTYIMLFTSQTMLGKVKHLTESQSHRDWN